MNFEVVQGDTKPIRRTLKHEGIGKLFDGETAPTVEAYIDRPATNAPTIEAEATVSLSSPDCVVVETVLTVPENAYVASYRMQWRIIGADDAVCTLPCEPDCLEVCAKVETDGLARNIGEVIPA